MSVLDNALSTIGSQAIHFLQLIFMPLFFVLFLTGLLFFLVALKNPHKKRAAYLFSIFGLVGLLLITYLPLLLVYYTNGPRVAVGNETVATIVEQVKPFGWKMYELLVAVGEPIIFTMFYVGIGAWLLAAKDPIVKRVGMGAAVSAPFIWVILHYSPIVYHFFMG